MTHQMTYSVACLHLAHRIESFMTQSLASAQTQNPIAYQEIKKMYFYDKNGRLDDNPKDDLNWWICDTGCTLEYKYTITEEIQANASAKKKTAIKILNIPFCAYCVQIFTTSTDFSGSAFLGALGSRLMLRLMY